MVRINDPQKQKVLYTLEIKNNVILFPCVQGLVFLRIINSKYSELSNYYNSLQII